MPEWRDACLTCSHCERITEPVSFLNKFSYILRMHNMYIVVRAGGVGGGVGAARLNEGNLSIRRERRPAAEHCDPSAGLYVATTEFHRKRQK
ncbi:hypothetical protein EVAR_33397_1 [Eumeta japonica]|uniref:Uncharacterized protein n=1 Tax=Eumeta variegata TaxID=151549 RepID=A0A4C1W298_EUMVA|nr:hypothetical protein EVAR_33397_1 [Eumeta japonica]